MNNRNVRNLMGALVFFTLLASCALLNKARVSIQDGEVGVRFDILSGLLTEPMIPGTYLVNPITEEVTIYSTLPQELSITVEDELLAQTVDQQFVLIMAVVTYQVDINKPNLVHVRWGDNYADNLVRPSFRGHARKAVSKFTLAEIQSDLDRVNLRIRETLELHLGEEGFVLNDLSLEMTFPE